MQARKPHAPQDGKTQPSAGRELGSCASVLHPRGETLTTTDEILLSFVDLCVLCGNGFGSPRKSTRRSKCYTPFKITTTDEILLSFVGLCVLCGNGFGSPRKSTRRSKCYTPFKITTMDEILLSFVDLCVLCGNGFGSPRNPPAEANAILHSNTLAEAFILINVL
jgi:hypothetical protein